MSGKVLAAENYVVVGVTLAVITVCCQVIFLPFLFSEVDAIREEFDREIVNAMKDFELSYEQLAEIRPVLSRKQREVVKSMVTADSTSDGPADHAKSQKRSHFSDELRKLAREEEDYGEASDYEDTALTPPPPSLSLPIGNSNPITAQNPQVTTTPICPLEENRCPVGPPGPPGTPGLPGAVGLDGIDGVTGSDALDELTPNYPTFCVTCPAGPDGKPGPTGPPGKAGLAGSSGIPGPSGKNGQPGAPGGYGSPGKQGAMGGRGNPGGSGMDGMVLMNTRGPKGPPGKIGAQGQAGEDGTINLTAGPVGEVGPNGLVGPRGADGLNGKRGETGEAGRLGQGVTCKCDELIKKAIELAEDSAYVAVEAEEIQNADGPTITGRSFSPEIRRNPQKASSLVAEGLPTLEELAKSTFAQEDDTVKKFAVAPSEVAVNEENGAASSVVDRSDRAPIAQRPTLFSPPRISAPKSFKLASASFVSRQKPVSGETKKKTRSEGGKKKKVVKVKRVRTQSHRILANDFTNLDEGEKSFKIEKEIARESEKKVVEREIRRSPVKNVKNGKVDKKLRRVRLIPSKRLASQQKENLNILENIAKSLGVLEAEPAKKLNRVPIP